MCAGADGSKHLPIPADDVLRWIDRGGTQDFTKRFWTVDPIDGTKGFLRGEQYAVALVLIENGEVVVAALACPNLPATNGHATGGNPGASASGSIFWAVRGRGAYQAADVGDLESTPPGAPIVVSACDTPATARFCESVESGHSAHNDAAAVAGRLGIGASPLRMDSQAKYAVVAREKLRSICACRPAPVIARRSGTTPPGR